MVESTRKAVVGGAVLGALALFAPLTVGAGSTSLVRVNTACASGNPCDVVDEPVGCCKDGVCDMTADCNDKCE